MMSTSAKLASFERIFYDLSENAYMSIVSKYIFPGFEVFMRHPFLVKILWHTGYRKGTWGVALKGLRINITCVFKSREIALVTVRLRLLGHI